MSDKKTVTVRIAGEEHSLRSHAEPEYTRECAAYVDKRIQEIKSQVGLLEGHKAAILAALSITDELFQANKELENLDDTAAERMEKLAAKLEGALEG